MENLRKPQRPSETLNLWNLVETDGTLGKLVEPCGLFWDLLEHSRTFAEVHRTLCDILELLRTFRVLLGPPGALLFFLVKNLRKPFFTFRTFVGRCLNFGKAYFEPSENISGPLGFFFRTSEGPVVPYGAHIREPFDVFQNCVQPSWTSRNMVDAFLSLCKASESFFESVAILHTRTFSDPLENHVAQFQHATAFL